MPHKVSELNDIYPTDCAILQAVRSEYAEWNWLYEHNYIRYNKMIDGVRLKLYEHQLVGKRMSDVFVHDRSRCHVHHKNGIRHENGAYNLQVTHPRQHQSIHKDKTIIYPGIQALHQLYAHCNGKVSRMGKHLDVNDSTVCRWLVQANIIQCPNWLARKYPWLTK